MSQARVAPDSRVGQSCNYGKCRALARSGAKWMEDPANFVF